MFLLYSVVAMAIDWQLEGGPYLAIIKLLPVATSFYIHLTTPNSFSGTMKYSMQTFDPVNSVISNKHFHYYWLPCYVVAYITHLNSIGIVLPITFQ